MPPLTASNAPFSFSPQLVSQQLFDADKLTKHGEDESDSQSSTDVIAVTTLPKGTAKRRSSWAQSFARMGLGLAREPSCVRAEDLTPAAWSAGSAGHERRPSSDNTRADLPVLSHTFSELLLHKTHGRWTSLWTPEKLQQVSTKLADKQVLTDLFAKVFMPADTLSLSQLLGLVLYNTVVYVEESHFDSGPGCDLKGKVFLRALFELPKVSDLFNVKFIYRDKQGQLVWLRDDQTCDRLFGESSRGRTKSRSYHPAQIDAQLVERIVQVLDKSDAKPVDLWLFTQNCLSQPLRDKMVTLLGELHQTQIAQSGIRNFVFRSDMGRTSSGAFEPDPLPYSTQHSCSTLRPNR